MPNAPKRYCPQRARLPDRRPSAARRGYDGAWRELRAAFLLKNPLCVAVLRDGRACGRPAVDVDHHLSLERGGTSDEANLRAYCHSCHSKKTVAFDGGCGRPKHTH